MQAHKGSNVNRLVFMAFYCRNPLFAGCGNNQKEVTAIPQKNRKSVGLTI